MKKTTILFTIDDKYSPHWQITPTYSTEVDAMVDAVAQNPRQDVKPERDVSCDFYVSTASKFPTNGRLIVDVARFRVILKSYNIDVIKKGSEQDDAKV